MAGNSKQQWRWFSNSIIPATEMVKQQKSTGSDPGQTKKAAAWKQCRVDSEENS